MWGLVKGVGKVVVKEEGVGMLEVQRSVGGVW